MTVISIQDTVGLNAPNRKQDVIKVQVMLNHFIFNTKLVGVKPLVLKPLAKDGDCGSKTRTAISAFQFQNGLISEEHLNGQIRPRGMTITFMNNHAGYIPKKEFEYTGLKKMLDRFGREAELENEAIEAIRSGFGLSKQEEQGMRRILKEMLKSEFVPSGDGVASRVQSTISVVLNGEKWVSFAKDFYAVFQPALGTTGAMASVGGFAFWCGLIGPFAQFWGFCILLVKARSHAEVYSAHAVVLTVVAWAFRDPMPKRSEAFWRRAKVLPTFGYLNEEELNEVWRETQTKTLRQLRAGLMQPSRPGLSPLDRAEHVRMGMRLMGRQTLCEAVLANMARKAKAEGNTTLHTALSGADSHADRIGYWHPPSPRASGRGPGG